MNPFGHTVTEHGDHVRLAVVGDVDFAAYPVLAARIQTLIEEDRRAVVVDCAGVTFLDSMGLRALVEGLRAADDRGQGFALAAPSPPVLRVMELSGTTELFPIRDPEPGETGS
ncbi:STAS domain-containing protein [Catenulispora sp. NF23]|uniref:Anti-sigma factor antagonist n=1 Tax=Catenulispora pinistramenti TaxID=2705254 RepID=A0ABS5KN63_9ACTN|nr:STAS domain-containing protein [Catenulispora pinistramenti]MBS2532826.1 STAS domain-containing protein [Catenulispora pinistramenti]MBS2547503.1 STAS domain-containing protein [Catenulispora pinistramenti]